MRLCNLLDEDFVNYKKPAMVLCAVSCDGKCWKEGLCDKEACQNAPLLKEPVFELTPQEIYERYRNNPITHALVFSGMEPALQAQEVADVIAAFRNNGCMDDVVIYTGYETYEIQETLQLWQQQPNILVKFGRYIQGDEPKYCALLGVTLASSNQLCLRIS